MLASNILGIGCQRALIKVMLRYWISLAISLAGDPKGSIDLRQSAGLCVQPEAAQDNPQNLSTTRTTVLCYVYQTLFFLTHMQKKKSGGMATQD